MCRKVQRFGRLSQIVLHRIYTRATALLAFKTKQFTNVEHFVAVSEFTNITSAERDIGNPAT